MDYKVEVVYEMRETIFVSADSPEEAKLEVKEAIFTESNYVISGSVQILRVDQA